MRPHAPFALGSTQECGCHSDATGSVVAGLVALLCGNGYIVGINQIYDVDIDAVNKPFLPVAAGELSKPVAWVSATA